MPGPPCAHAIPDNVLNIYVAGVRKGGRCHADCKEELCAEIERVKIVADILEHLKNAGQRGKSREIPAAEEMTN